MFLLKQIFLKLVPALLIILYFENKVKYFTWYDLLGKHFIMLSLPQ